MRGTTNETIYALSVARRSRVVNRAHIFVMSVVVFDRKNTVHAQCHQPVSYDAQAMPARPVHALVRCARSHAAYEQTHAEHNAQCLQTE